MTGAISESPIVGSLSRLPVSSSVLFLPAMNWAAPYCRMHALGAAKKNPASKLTG